MFDRAQFIADPLPPLRVQDAPAEQNQWLLWQLADSAFPTGGFAHSGGLEAAWQHGELRNRSELKSFIEASLHQFGHGSLPFMLAAIDEPGEVFTLDRFCDCFTSNHVANRASRLQGQALWSSAQRIFATPKLKHLLAAGAPPHFHLAPVFGVVADALGLGRRSAAELFFFLHLRGLTASAVRLGIVGPMEAQTIQFESASFAREMLDDCQDVPVSEIAQTAPLLEIWQGGQDRLYSRLFQS